MNLFSECFRHSCQSTLAVVYLADPQELGPFMKEAFETAMPESGTGRQQMQALGRWLMQKNMPSLMRDTPELLTPLATLFRDPEGLDVEQRPRTKGICCHSHLASVISSAFVQTALNRMPDRVGRMLFRIFTDMQEDPKFNLYKPLGRSLVIQFESRITDLDALQDAWMLVKTNREGPLKLVRAARETERAQVDQALAAQIEQALKDPDFTILENIEPQKNAKAADQLVDDDPELTAFFRNLAEDPEVNARALSGVDIEKPVKTSARIDITHAASGGAATETFQTFEHILENEPAFVGKHLHPQHGLLFVMISLDGRNKLNQFVHRGCAVLNPMTGSLDSHTQINSILGPIRHTDEADIKYTVKAIPWRRGLCGRYWTNVKRSDDAKHNDVEELKRWFLLTVDEKNEPFLQIWSGAQGEANFNRYLSGMRRKMKQRKAA